MKKRKITAIICLMLCLVLGISGLSVGIVKAVEQTEEPIELTATDQIILEGDGSETVTSEDEALQYLINNADSFGIVDGEETLVAQESSEAAGYKYYSFMQTYEGIPVYGNSMNIMTDSQSGEVLLATGVYEDIDKNIDLTPEVDVTGLSEGIQTYLTEIIGYENVVAIDVSDSAIDIDNLVIFSGDDSDNLAYKFYASFNADDIYDYYVFLSDADTGKVLDGWSCFTSESVTTKDCYNNNIDIEVEKNENNNYSLIDKDRNIYIYDLQMQDSKAKGVDWPKEEVKSSDKNQWDAKAASCMSFTAKAYDYYKSNLNIDGWNNKKGKIKVYYNDNDDNGNNAYQQTPSLFNQYTILSIGSNVVYADVVAHEYSHAVQKFVTPLQYKGESGSIIEAYADVMAQIIENDKLWCMQLSGNSTRNIKEPDKSLTKDGNIIIYPSKIDGKGYMQNIYNHLDKAHDYGWVHKNSTVLSHASYCMTRGDNRLNNTQLAQLWFNTLKNNSSSKTTMPEFGKLMSVTAYAMAQSGNLEPEQAEYVAQNLTNAGIKLDKIITVYKKFKLSVTDCYHQLLDNATIQFYELKIVKKSNKYKIARKPSYEIVTDDDNQYIDISSLEEDKLYAIKITDNVYGESVYYDEYIYCAGANKKNNRKKYWKVFTTFRKGVVKDFSLTDDELDIAANEIKYLNTDIKPAGVKNEKDAYKIAWKSSDENIVTVDSNGKLKGIAQGTATITATLTNKINGKTNTFKSEVTVNVTKKQRETVLVLDCSSSMNGKPLNEMKQSAIKFCEALMNGGGENYVEIVTFGTSASKSGFKSNLSDLTSYINNISAGGSTNMYKGLSVASDELSSSNRKNSVQNIVLMSDGEPCEGSTQNSGVMSNWVSAHSGYSYYFRSSEKYGNAVCSLADSLKPYYNIYSLGFFHTMSADEKAYCSYLIDYIDNKGYYEVTDADNLQISFDDISGHVNNGSKIVITVACPVDVSVSLNGETLSSSRADYNESASFGTLKKTGAANDIKVLELDSANNYDISFKGNGSGTMDYTVTYYNSDDSIEQTRNFTSVPISASTLMTSNTAKDQDTELKIDSDGDGQVDSIWTASADKDGSETFKDEKAITAEVTATAIDVEDENETEEKSSDKTVWIVLIVCSSIVILASIGAIAAVALKKVPDEKDNNKNNKDNKDKNSGDVKKACGIVVLLDGSMKGKQLSFESGKVHSIGKDATKADVLIDKSYQSISRLHCTIEFDERHNGYYITDYSSNGTYLMNSGKRLEHGKRTLIARNTVIYLAQKNCRIELK